MNKPTLSLRAKGVLATVIALREYYRGGYKVKPLTYCPLCAIGPGCSACPWRCFDETWCLDKHGDICDKREHPSARWRAASIKRLTRWARLIRNGTYDKKLKEAK